MRPLFAIISCHKFSSRRNSQRETWLLSFNKEVADYKYFLGRGPEGAVPAEDEIFLDVEDDYNSLPAKVKAVMQWALDHDYEWVLKTDDDVYIYPDRILDGYDHHLYTGHPNGWVSPQHPKGYMSGFAYWLAPQCVKAIAEAPLDPKIPHEDRWVGGVLFRAGLNSDGGYYDKRYVVVCTYQRNMWQNFARQDGAAFAQFEPGDMQYFHSLCMGTAEPELAATGRPVNVARPAEEQSASGQVLGRPSKNPGGGRIFRLGRLTGY